MKSDPIRNRLVYEADDVPPAPLTILLAIQYVFLLVAPITITPLVIVRFLDLPYETASWVVFAALICSGITTIIQIQRVGRIGAGYLLFMGSSAAFVGCGAAAVELGGFALLGAMAIASAPLQMLFAWSLGRLRKIVTPLVGGVVIMLIVVSVLPIALELLERPVGPEHDATINLWPAGATLLTIVVLSAFGNAQVRVASPLLGLVAGTVVAYPLGLMSFATVATAPWIGLPAGNWPGLDFSFPPGSLPIVVAFAVVTLVGALESVGDAMAVQRVSLRKFRKIDYDRVQGAVYTDGIGNALSGAMGTVPNTTYSNTIAVIDLTGVASRRVGICAAAGLIALAFMPKVAALLAALPSPIIAAFLFVLLAMLFTTGIRLAAAHGLSFESGIILGLAFWAGYAFENEMVFADRIPEGMAAFTSNGMAMGALTAVALSLLFSIRPRSSKQLRLPPEAGRLGELHQFSGSFAERMGLPQALRGKLDLAVEEIFMHLCNAPRGDEPAVIAFSISLANDHLTIEVQDSSLSPDLDEALPDFDPAEAESIEPDELGLALLSRICSDVRHLRIANVNYISCDIPKES